ncbi:hypothetical protein DL98DRAFT_591146 [Cadophora sp. DSE1049]|nr:hypothetical protein DL98DRAFT_591146 [Cadophora sp. DSE1049]
MAASNISKDLERLALTPASKKKVILDSDIWYLVFAEINPLIRESKIPKRRKTNGHNTRYMSKVALRAWLHDTRLVSHEFDVIVKRHAYEFIDLSQTSFMNRLTRVTAPPCEEVKNNIRQNTKVLELSPDLFSSVKEATEDFLDSCVHLQRVLCYDYEYNRTFNWGESAANLISRYLSVFMHSQKRVKPLTRCRMIIQSSSFEFVAVDDTGKGAPKTSPEPGRDNPHTPQVLEAFTIENKWRWPPQLESLSYPTPRAKLLLPMRKLGLIGYHWSYSESDFGLVWDFSHLQSLKLSSLALKHFSKNAPVKHLKNLQELKIISSVYDPEPDAECRLLFKLFLAQLNNLRSFKMENSSWMKPSRFDFEKKLLVEIIARCPQLEKIDLGYDGSRSKISEMLEVLASVENIRKICFYAKDRIVWQDNIDYSGPCPTADTDYDTVERIMRYLHSQKIGKSLMLVKFIQDSASMPPRWRPENWESFGMKFVLDSVTNPIEVRKR